MSTTGPARARLPLCHTGATRSGGPKLGSRALTDSRGPWETRAAAHGVGRPMMTTVPRGKAGVPTSRRTPPGTLRRCAGSGPTAGRAADAGGGTGGVQKRRLRCRGGRVLWRRGKRRPGPCPKPLLQAFRLLQAGGGRPAAPCRAVAVAAGGVAAAALGGPYNTGGGSGDRHEQHCAISCFVDMQIADT